MINILLTQEGIKILEKERKRIVEKQNELQIKVQECQDRKEAIDELLEQEIEDKCSEDINDNESIDEINVKMSFDASRYVNNSKFEKVSDSGEYDNKYTPIEKIKRIYESIFK